MISIVIPVYNTEDHIQDCVNSIISQSYKDIEIILVDDGSKDKSAAICDTLATKDLRIHTYHKQNGGAASARKLGVEKASGEWIMFVDSDDQLCNDSVQNFAKLAETNKFDIIIGTLILNNGTIFKHQTTGVISNIEYLNAILTKKTSKGPVAKLFRKDLFNKFNWETPHSIIQNEDLLMLIYLAKVSKSIFIDQNLICYKYLYRENSLSKSQPMPYEGWFQLFTIIKNIITPLLTNEDSLYKSFFSYRLNILYYLTVKKGLFIDGKSEQQIQILIDESLNYSLSRKETYILHILSSHHKQRFLYFYLNLKSSVIRFLKSIIK